MQTLVIDANFLMSAYRFKVDAMCELGKLATGKHRLVTSNQIIRELEGLARERGVAGKGARYSLGVIEKEKVEIIETDKNADDWILEYCSETGATACTNDIALKKNLKKRGVRVIALLGKSKLGYV